jgi:uncharacterized protein (TIGR03435 family)
MRKTFAAILIGVSAAAFAQTAAFEVASVKRNRSGDTGSSGRMANGAVTIVNQPARLLIVNAYGFRPNRIIGGPSWVGRERFDVSARAPANTPDGQLTMMLRTLLAERFKLVVRRETRDEAIYALVLARADGGFGPKLRLTADCVKDPVPRDPGGGIHEVQANQPVQCGWRMSMRGGQTTVLQGGNLPIGELAAMLRNIGASGREIVDRTGVTANVDFDLRYAPDALRGASSATDNSPPSLFTALEEQLGLKLESSRGPVEYLVIERIGRPTPD